MSTFHDFVDLGKAALESRQPSETEQIIKAAHFDTKTLGNELYMFHVNGYVQAGMNFREAVHMTRDIDRREEMLLKWGHDLIAKRNQLEEERAQIRVAWFVGGIFTAMVVYACLRSM